MFRLFILFAQGIGNYYTDTLNLLIICSIVGEFRRRERQIKPENEAIGEGCAFGFY